MLRYLSLGVSLVLTFQAHAAEKNFDSNQVQSVVFAENTGDVLRIESAEHLRTYSQEVAAAACFLYNDIDANLSRALLEEASAGFDKHHNALVHGDEVMGIIGAEKRKKTQLKLTEVGSVWSEMRAGVEVLLSDGKNADAVNVIKSQNMPLFELTNVLVSDIEAQYANPAEVTHANTLLLDIVGRQSMMTQKIAKDACKIFTGNTSDEIKKLLEGSMAIYEASLDALLNGMPQLGIQPAPNAEIADALVAGKSDWATVRPLLTSLIAGETVERDQQVFLFKHMVQEMVRLEEVSGMYLEHAQNIY